MKTQTSTTWNRQTGRWLLRFFIRIVLVFAILVTASVIMAKVQTWQVERAIKRFRTAPSQTRADELVTLLIDNAATQEQGERILALLLRPQVTTRSTYPAGRPAKMSVAMPFHIDDGQGRVRVAFKQHVWADGRLIDTSTETIRMLYGFPEILTAWLRPLEPGLYHAEIRYECRVTDAGKTPTLLGRLWASLTARLLSRSVTSSPRGRQTLYECRFTVPIDVHLVEQDRAERLELIADAQVGEALRAALVVETRTEHETYLTAAGLRECRGGPNISFQALPVAAAFEMSLRLPDGREIPYRPKRIRFRNGSHGRYRVEMRNFGIEKPGEYAGTLVLRSDPDFAYEDPAIKTLWNGTLEFPIHFTVGPKPNAGG